MTIPPSSFISPRFLPASLSRVYPLASWRRKGRERESLLVFRGLRGSTAAAKRARDVTPSRSLLLESARAAQRLLCRELSRKFHSKCYRRSGFFRGGSAGAPVAYIRETYLLYSAAVVKRERRNCSSSTRQRVNKDPLTFINSALIFVPPHR